MAAGLKGGLANNRRDTAEYSERRLEEGRKGRYRDFKSARIDLRGRSMTPRIVYKRNHPPPPPLSRKRRGFRSGRSSLNINLGE